MARDNILQRVRTALHRNPDQLQSGIPAARLLVPMTDSEVRTAQFCRAVESLAGKTYCAASKADACAYVSSILKNRAAIASNAHFLRECGIAALSGVQTGLHSKEDLRRECAAADLGITSADYALADTGTLVLLSSAEEARMISLLPPMHLAVISRDRILTGLDEPFTLLPHPDQKASSMVFITGPSRTADIEQILICGVHGPGEIHIVII